MHTEGDNLSFAIDSEKKFLIPTFLCNFNAKLSPPISQYHSNNYLF